MLTALVRIWFLCSLLVASSLLLSCGGGGGGGSAIEPATTPSITSIDNTAPTPFTVLQIATSGLTPSAATSVTFSDNANYSVTMSAIRVTSNGTVVVGTPLFINGTTGTVGPGTVSVSVSQGSQSTNSTTISIQDIPTLAKLGIPLGQMSHAFYVFATQVTANRIQQLDEMSVSLQNVGVNQDFSKTKSYLQDLMKRLILARKDVDGIILNHTTVINAGTALNGTPIQINAATVEAMDRVFGAWALAQFNPQTSPTSSNPTAVAKRAGAIVGSAIPGYLVTGVAATDFANAAADPNGSAYDLLVASVSGIATVVEKYSLVKTTQEMSISVGYFLASAAMIPTFYNAATDMGKTLSDYYQGKDTTQDLINLEKNVNPLFENSTKLAFVAAAAVFPPTAPVVNASLFLLGILDIVAKHIDDENSKLDAYLAMQRLIKETSKGQTIFKGNVSQTNQTIASPPDSVALCCFGAGALGITGLSDNNGDYAIPVPLGMTKTNYGSMSATVSDSITGTVISSKLVNVSPTCANGATDYPTCTPPPISSIPIFRGTAKTTATVSTPNLDNCSPNPLVGTATFTDITAELVLDANPLALGPLSGTLYLGPTTQTTTIGAMTCIINGGGTATSVTYPGTTSSGDLPGYSVPISGHSDGTNIVIDPFGYDSERFTATVSTAPVTGIVQFFGQHIFTLTNNVTTSIITRTYTLTWQR